LLKEGEREDGGGEEERERERIILYYICTYPASKKTGKINNTVYKCSIHPVILMKIKIGT